MCEEGKEKEEEREGDEGKSEEPCENQREERTDLMNREESADSDQHFSATKPNHPDPKFIIKQTLSDRTLSFQTQWYSKFKWLHFDPNVDGVLCFYCSKAFKTQVSSLAKNTEPAFVSTGFKNWKKALERFSSHEKSDCHKTAVTTCVYEDRSVKAQLYSVQASQQEEARANLLKIIGAVQLLARQGLALRGHDDSEGNLHQVLKYKAEEDLCLRKWLSGRKDYTSAQIQNELLSLLSSSIIRDIADITRSLPQLQFSVMMDGTQDVSGKKQEAICLRYVDNDLMIHEEFIGLYEVSVGTGENLAKVVKDVLVRLNLPISGLRGQAYDGAANMAGRYSGAQAIIKKEQPLAPYIHCGAHCVNLITQHACTASRVVHSALQWVHELGILFGQSGKFKSLFKEVAKSVQGSFQTIRPLCPTRWTVRSSAIHAVLNQYESVMLALNEMAAGSSDTANRANGLHDRFQQGNVVIGLLLALEAIEELENLNTSLQSRTQTINGMLSAVAYVRDAVANKRNSERFQIVYTKASEMCQILDLSPIALPHTRNPPKRLTGQACAHVHSSPSEYYKTEFTKCLMLWICSSENVLSRKGCWC